MGLVRRWRSNTQSSGTAVSTPPTRSRRKTGDRSYKAGDMVCRNAGLAPGLVPESSGAHQPVQIPLGLERTLGVQLGREAQHQVANRVDDIQVVRQGRAFLGHQPSAEVRGR